jgi:hypothetical protein
MTTKPQRIEKPDLPEGWRPEWRAPRKTRARAREEAGLPQCEMTPAEQRRIALLEQPLPDDATLRDEALRTLRALALDTEAMAPARVAAARTLLEATKGVVPEDPTSAASVDELWAVVEAELARRKGGSQSGA